MKIAVISNPGSKRNRLKGFHHDLEKRFPSSKYPIVHLLPEDRSYERVLGEAVKSGADVIAINSGDGGAHKIMTKMIEIFGIDAPPVLVIPGGTINVLSHALGHRRLMSWVIED